MSPSALTDIPAALADVLPINYPGDFPSKLSFLFHPHRYKVLWGGRGGAKSWGIARALLIIGSHRRLRVMCAREIQILETDLTGRGYHHDKSDRLVLESKRTWSAAGWRHPTMATPWR